MALLLLAACAQDDPEPYVLPAAIAGPPREVLPPSTPTSGGLVEFQPIFEMLPPCDVSLTAAELPELPTPIGDLWLWPSGHAAPIGAVEVIDGSARLGDGGRDVAMNGPLNVEVSPAFELVAQTPMVQGEASVRVRVLVAGPAPLTVKLADGRSASVGVRGFQSRLPRLLLEVGADAWAALHVDVEANVFVEGTLREQTPGGADIGEPHPVRLRLHGGSSRQFRKKSMRVDLLQGHRLQDGRRRAILRAEFVDKSMLRNWLGKDLVRAFTGLPVSNARHVHLRVDDRYIGVMLDVERLDGDLLQARGLERNGSLYEADPPLEIVVPGGNLSPLPDLDRYQRTYPRHAGPFEWEDLRLTIEDLLQRPDAGLALDLDRYFALDEVLIYWAAMAVMQNHDMIRKNYYLYRQVDDSDRRWRLLPWDLDLTFGHLWSEQNDVLEEAIVFNGPIDAGRNIGHPFYNHLFDRLMKLPPSRARYRELLRDLVQAALAPGVMEPRLQTVACTISADVMADRRKRASNSEWAGRVQEISSFLKARRGFLLESLAQGL